MLENIQLETMSLKHMWGKRLFLKRFVLHFLSDGLSLKRRERPSARARVGGIRWWRRDPGSLIFSKVFVHKRYRRAAGQLQSVFVVGKNDALRTFFTLSRFFLRAGQRERNATQDNSTPVPT